MQRVIFAASGHCSHQLVDAIAVRADHRGIVIGREPAAAVEIGECDAAPVDVGGARGIAIDLDAHHHGGVFLDFADCAEGDAVAEAGHQSGLNVDGAHVAGREAGNYEEECGTDDERANCDKNRGETERAIQFLGERSAWLKSGRDSPLRTAANLKRDKGGDSQHEENRERNQKARFDGKNRRSKN